MRVLVSGVGQGGTCLLVEVLRGLNLVNFSPNVEDRKFLDYPELPENYGTKLTTDATEMLTIDNFWDVPDKLRSCMDKYKDLYIVFSLRHPLDVFMSQLVRGQKRVNGGDTEGLSDVGTPWGAMLAITHAYVIFKFLKHHFPERILPIKMEDLVLEPKKTVVRIAKYFNVRATKAAHEFYKHNRNLYQKERYGDTLDKSVVGLHDKQLEMFGNGFFKNRQAYIDVAFLLLSSIIKDLNYTTWRE